jgi:acyl-CoA thioesterase-1
VIGGHRLRCAALALLSAALVLPGCRNEPSAATAPASVPAPSATPARSPTVPIDAAAAPAISPRAPSTAVASPAGSSTAATRPTPVVVFLGDSLTAGLGLSADEAWPTLLAEQLAAAGTPIRAVNAGVSGDTSAGGLRRLSWLLRQRPDVVVVELGANDGMRGQPVAGVETNLRTIVEQSRAAGAHVLLLGLRVAPSLGGECASRFAALYPRLARELDVPLVPFMLEGVAGDPDLNLPDGIHPNAEGQRKVAAVVRPHLERLLAEAPAAQTAR